MTNPYSDTVLFVFIIRDCEQWLNSMYNHPYSIQQPRPGFDGFSDFITQPTVTKEPRRHHPTHTDEKEKNHNLFELRYAKFREYQRFCNDEVDLHESNETNGGRAESKHHNPINCVLVKLSALNEAPKKFVDLIATHFQIEAKDTFEEIVGNVKEITGKGLNGGRFDASKKTEYKLSDVKNSGDFIDVEVEEEIGRLGLMLKKSTDGKLVEVW